MNVMGKNFDENDDEYLELLAEYENYIKKTAGAYEDFDEWLEIEYGGSRKKVMKRKFIAPRKYNKEQ